MTHTCCPKCRLRFASVASDAARCTTCQGELEPALPSQLVGYRLGVLAETRSLADAVAATLPDPGWRR